MVEYQGFDKPNINLDKNKVFDLQHFKSLSAENPRQD